MGDRFEWTEKCPKCRANIEVWYAESCGVTTVTCRKCMTLFNIVMGFRLIESSGEQAEPGGQGETKRKEEKMSDQEAAINIARDAYCGERPEDEHEDR